MYQDMKSAISTQDIMNKLCVSRNYVTRNITHVVKRIENPYSSLIWFDTMDLRKWLIQHATFTQQTKYVDLAIYMKDSALDCPSRQKVLGSVPPAYDDKRRGQYPHIPVKPFDFWDKPLVFPKNYTNNTGRRLSAEMCYREMFRQGAIKIQLGSQKTMFYIPEHSTDEQLVSADWIPMKGCQYLLKKNISNKKNDRQNEEFDIIFNAPPEKRAAIISALRKGFNIKRILPPLDELSETSCSLDRYVCTIKVPSRSR